MREGDLATARAKLEKALDQDPDTATTQMAAGFLYDRLGEDKKAKSSFERAMKLEQRRSDDHEQLCGVPLPQGRQEARGGRYLLQAAKSPLYRTPGGRLRERRALRARRRSSEGRGEVFPATRSTTGRTSSTRCSRWRTSRTTPATTCRPARSSIATRPSHRFRRRALARIPDRARPRRQRPGRELRERLKRDFAMSPEMSAAARGGAGGEVTQARSRDRRAADGPGRAAQTAARARRARRAAGRGAAEPRRGCVVGARDATTTRRLARPVFVRGHLRRYASLLGLD